MIAINKDKGEVIFFYESDKGLVQGRITYFKNMLDELTFNLSARTVPHFGDVEDVATLLMALGSDLKVEARRVEGDDVTGT